MSAAITIDLARTIAALDRVQAAAIDLDPLLADIGEYEAGSTKQRIRDGRSPDGTPFKPLNPFYALTKKGPGILREGGDLARIIWQLAMGGVQVGSSPFYAEVQQEGRVIKPKTKAALVFSLGGNRKVFAKSVTIPARPFVGLSPADEAEIIRISTAFFGAAAGGE